MRVVAERGDGCGRGRCWGGGALQERVWPEGGTLFAVGAGRSREVARSDKRAYERTILFVLFNTMSRAATPARQIDVRFGDWSAKDVEWLNEYQLLTAKPAVYLGEAVRYWGSAACGAPVVGAGV